MQLDAKHINSTKKDKLVSLQLEFVFHANDTFAKKGQMIQYILRERNSF